MSRYSVAIVFFSIIALMGCDRDIIVSFVISQETMDHYKIEYPEETNISATIYDFGKQDIDGSSRLQYEEKAISKEELVWKIDNIHEVKKIGLKRKHKYRMIISMAHIRDEKYKYYYIPPSIDINKFLEEKNYLIKIVPNEYINENYNWDTNNN